MKKRILAISLVVAMLAIAVIGGSLAYFTDTKDNVNTFTYGNVEIKLDETNIADPEGARVTENNYTGLVPGKEFVKDPVVHNTGSTDTYVRVKVRVENALNWIGYAVGTPGDFGDDAAIINAVFGPLGEGWAITDSYMEGPLQGTPGVYTSDFIYVLTYNTKLAPGESTTPAFSKFVVPVNLTQELVQTNVSQDGTFHVTVTAEAVQTETFASAADAFAATFDAKA